MKKEIRRQTIQFTAEENEMIMKYPGKGFSKKLHQLLLVHRLLLGEESTGEPDELIEKLLKAYLGEFYPELGKEIERRREEAKKLQEATSNICDVLDLIEKLKLEISDIVAQAEPFIEGKLSLCVTARRHKELPENIKRMVDKAQKQREVIKYEEENI